MNTPKIVCPRQTAVLYLAWEFGIARAIKMMRTLPMTGYVTLTDVPAVAICATEYGRRRLTLRGCTRWAARVTEMAQYQAGRLRISPVGCATAVR